MNRMVVAFFPDGSVQYTLKDEFFNPLPREERSIERMTDILWDKQEQKFYFQFLKGPYAGKVYAGLWTTGSHPETHDILFAEGDIRPTYFPTYVEAVAEEIAIINDLRQAGVRI